MTSKKAVKSKIVGLAFLSLFLRVSTAHGADDREARLRAAFVYNFASFTQWPSTVSTFRIAIWRDAGAAAATKTELRGKQVHGAELEVTALSETSDIKDFRIILIDSDASSADLEKFLEPLMRKPILTVSRIDSHCSTGVMICFYKDGEKLRFAISKSAVERAGLKLSSQLLKLARMLP